MFFLFDIVFSLSLLPEIAELRPVVIQIRCRSAVETVQPFEWRACRRRDIEPFLVGASICYLQHMSPVLTYICI